jgi:uncharacterized membrane protein YgdD (TMEM256/DUF423 family)
MHLRPLIFIFHYTSCTLSPTTTNPKKLAHLHICTSAYYLCPMHKPFIAIAAFIGAITVGLGAFGAHGLKNILSPAQLVTYETAVRYQFYHVLALLTVGILFQQYAGKALRWAGRLFVVGIVIFSGSLYLLCLLPQFPWLGAITPLGGTCFIAGWLCLAAAVLKNRG